MKDILTRDQVTDLELAPLVSTELLELARLYLEIVDSGDPNRQGDERTQAHNRLIQAMLDAGIIQPPPNRVQVRWLARYLIQTDYLNREHTPPRQYIMFVRKNSGLLPRLEALPPFVEEEEKDALRYYVPVRVTIEALLGDRHGTKD